MLSAAIATRKFTFGNQNSSYVEVLVYLPVKDQEDYRCKYEIKERDSIVKEGYALGVDSMQALTLALQKLGADILFSNEGKEQKLFWNGQNQDLGLLLPKVP
jgi:hypothetical protein